MKFFRFFLVMLTAGFFLSSCQKELSYESGTARGSLKEDGTGDCLPVLVNGTYKKDTVLTASNYVDVQLNITETGSYFINTDTINGYSFSASGTVDATGLATVRLIGSGKPLAPGLDVFTVKFDTSSCAIDIVVTTAVVADFRLGGGGGTCTGAGVSGTYTALVPLTATNTATVDVTVNTPGAYSITTNSLADNGVTFSASGTLNASSTSITLVGSGTPVAAGTFTYILSDGTTTCSFDVTYGAAAPPASFTFDCATTGTPAGDYIYGKALDPAVNTVTVNVNVVTAGSYTITSAPATGGPDGVTFSALGTFTATGPQTVTLTGSGTPTRSGIVFYNISSTSATNGPCSIGVYYDFLLVSFDGGATFKNFTFDYDVTLNSNDHDPGYDALEIAGFASEDPADLEQILISPELPTPAGAAAFNTTTPVSYTANDFPAKRVFAAYQTNTTPPVIYAGGTTGTVQTTPFTVTITFCTATRVEGTFSGPIKDNSGAGPGQITISGTFGLRR